MAICLSLSATVILFCIFLPKLRVVLLKPSKNVRSKNSNVVKAVYKTQISQRSDATTKPTLKPEQFSKGTSDGGSFHLQKQTSIISTNATSGGTSLKRPEAKKDSVLISMSKTNTTTSVNSDLPSSPGNFTFFNLLNLTKKKERKKLNEFYFKDAVKKNVVPNSTSDLLDISVSKSVENNTSTDSTLQCKSSDTKKNYQTVKRDSRKSSGVKSSSLRLSLKQKNEIIRAAEKATGNQVKDVELIRRSSTSTSNNTASTNKSQIIDLTAPSELFEKLDNVIETEIGDDIEEEEENGEEDYEQEEEDDTIYSHRNKGIITLDSPNTSISDYDYTMKTRIISPIRRKDETHSSSLDKSSTSEPSTSTILNETTIEAVVNECFDQLARNNKISSPCLFIKRPNSKMSATDFNNNQIDHNTSYDSTDTLKTIGTNNSNSNNKINSSEIDNKQRQCKPDSSARLIVSEKITLSPKTRTNKLNKKKKHHKKSADTNTNTNIYKNENRKNNEKVDTTKSMSLFEATLHELTDSTCSSISSSSSSSQLPPPNSILLSSTSNMNELYSLKITFV
jgi:hypothetical protein